MSCLSSTVKHFSRACLSTAAVDRAPLPLFLQSLGGVLASKTIVSAENCAAPHPRNMLQKNSGRMAAYFTIISMHGSLLCKFCCSEQQQSIVISWCLAPLWSPQNGALLQRHTMVQSSTVDHWPNFQGGETVTGSSADGRAGVICRMCLCISICICRRRTKPKTQRVTGIPEGMQMVNCHCHDRILMSFRLADIIRQYTCRFIFKCSFSLKFFSFD